MDVRAELVGTIHARLRTVPQEESTTAQKRINCVCNSLSQCSSHQFVVQNESGQKTFGEDPQVAPSFCFAQMPGPSLFACSLQCQSGRFTDIGVACPRALTDGENTRPSEEQGHV